MCVNKVYMFKIYLRCFDILIKDCYRVHLMPLQLKSAIKFTCETEINYPERRKFFHVIVYVCLCQLQF